VVVVAGGGGGGGGINRLNGNANLQSLCNAPGTRRRV